jgi:TonB-linked SusC/RagA family outer membrane protein
MRLLQRLFVARFLFIFCLLFAGVSVHAQTRPVTGTVLDQNGKAIPGATVSVDGSGTATQTDENGHFTIRAATGARITVSSVNYETNVFDVGTASDYPLVLQDKITALTDVVVVGYGTQKKVNLVGAVSAVKVDDKVTTRALPNLSTALSGMVPGLAVNQNSGMAGRNGATLLIRGLGSVNNSSPLIVVDGMPDVDINRLNINDIESVSVLKDATAASVYGSRAANGVILVTTKSGSGQKKTALTFSSNLAVTKPTKPFGFMADYPRALTLHQRRAAANTLPANFYFKNGTIDEWMAKGMVDPLRYPNTDWWDVILRDGTFQNYNMSANGGNDVSNFYMSVGYKNENGLQINNDYDQYNARINYDYKIRKNIKTGIKLFGNASRYTFALLDGFTDPNSSNTAGLDMRYAIAGITPYDPVTGYYGGVMAYNEDPQAYNPYTVYVNMLTRQKRQEGQGSMYLQWEPVKELVGSVEYYLNYYNQFQVNANIPNRAYNFQTNSFGSRVYVGDNAGVSNANWNGFKTMFNARVNYHHAFGENHEVSALAVYSEEYWYNRYLGASRNDRIHPSLSEIDAALTTIQSASGNSNSEGLRSYISRLNYTAYNKYLLEGNFRVDGSSKFLKGSQYGFFPSGAFGWRFTEEKFLNFLKQVVNDGKLRVSYGALGNNSGVGRFEQQETLDAAHYMINNNIAMGLTYSQLINRELTWESTKVFNTGLDLGFLRNRLRVELDYYDRFTHGMLRPSDISIFLEGAYNAPRRNIGNLRNRGVELNLKWAERLNEFNYGATFNASYNVNRLEKWNEYLGRGTTFLNMPYGFVYTYVDRGIAQTWNEVYKATPQGAGPGDLLYEDLNGDGRIDGNDRKALKVLSGRPTTYGSLNLFAAWKGIDFSIFFTGATGRKSFYLSNYKDLNFGNARNAMTWDHWNNPWTVENRNAPWPELGGPGRNQDQSTFWLDDMSYVRLKNIQLGYSVPASLLNKITAKSLRVAFSGENLTTLTRYRGLDPEKQGNANDVYPINRSYNLSILLGF